METKLNFLSLLFLMFIISACNVIERQGEKTSPGQPVFGSILKTGSESMAEQIAQQTSQKTAQPPVSLTDAELSSLFRLLDELAELERAGQWFQGMALTESEIREKTGDLAGAVAAAYKELSWAYGMGFIKKDDVERSLLNLLETRNEEIVIKTATAMIAFLNEQWAETAVVLTHLFNDPDEPDSFSRWMILVCTLERENASSEISEARRTASAYRSIRARYAQFPEYWYRGARTFSGVIAAEFAENCINLSPQGPFADECRKILAAYTGLGTENGLSIKTKWEIEAIISLSVNSGNPQILDSLMPLVSLPDNPYTIYAVNRLRSLTGITGFRDYFTRKASSSSGRLAERLSYISRG